MRLSMFCTQLLTLKFVIKSEKHDAIEPKNSEALANFSEQLDIEGRSLWQDARRRFMHNRAAIFSLCVLLLITLFVIFAPMMSPFCTTTPIGK